MEEALSVLVSGQTEGERKGWFLPEWKHFPCPEQLTGQRTVSHASPLNPSEHRQALSRLHTPFPPHSSMAGSPAPTRLDASEVSTLFAQMGEGVKGLVLVLKKKRVSKRVSKRVLPLRRWVRCNPFPSTRRPRTCMFRWRRCRGALQGTRRCCSCWRRPLARSPLQPTLRCSGTPLSRGSCRGCCT